MLFSGLLIEKKDFTYKFYCMESFNQTISEIINAMPPFRPEGIEVEIRISVFYDAVHSEKVEIPEHEHPFYEMAWMVQGEMNYLVDGMKISNNVENRQVFFLPAGKLHRRYSQSENSCIRSMELSLTPTGPNGVMFLKKLNDVLEKNHYRFTLSQTQFNLTRMIEAECRREKCFSRLVLEYEISALLFDILQNFLPPSGVSTDERSGTHREITHYIQMRIEDLVNRTFEMDALTSQFNLSARHLNRIFRAEYGMSIRRYADLRRLAHAERLLGDPANTVADVAAALGFSSPSHFIVFFKKYRNVTPAHYRDHLSLK